MYLLHHILKASDSQKKKKKTDSVTLIESDRTDHTTDIKRQGYRISLIILIISFLSNRKHKVRYEKCLFQWDEITCGVHQGTKLRSAMLP